MRYRGGFGLGTVVWVIVGAFVAGSDHYFDQLGSFGRVLSALLAMLLWPLVLLGLDFQIR